MSESVTVYLVYKKVGDAVTPIMNGVGGTGIYTTVADAELAKTLEQASCTDSKTEFGIFEMNIPKANDGV